MNNEANSSRIAVIASGTGSNFATMVHDPDVANHIALLVCDQPGAPVVEIAEENGVETFVFAASEFENKLAYERKLIEHLQVAEIEWIFLAGYMRIIGKKLLKAYEGKIVNIHPSYLPKFPGIDAVGQALRSGVESTGVTVHFVDEGIDTGPIIAQEVVDILPEDTIDVLTARIQRVEYELYPKVMKQLLGVYQ